MDNVLRAATQLWMHLGGLLNTQEATDYRLMRLLATSRVHS